MLFDILMWRVKSAQKCVEVGDCSGDRGNFDGVCPLAAKTAGESGGWDFSMRAYIACSGINRPSDWTVVRNGLFQQEERRKHCCGEPRMWGCRVPKAGLFFGQDLIRTVECMEKNSKNIANIRNYLLRALYESPKTINFYYTMAVNRDLKNGGKHNGR